MHKVHGVAAEYYWFFLAEAAICRKLAFYRCGPERKKCVLAAMDYLKSARIIRVKENRS